MEATTSEMSLDWHRLKVLPAHRNQSFFERPQMLPSRKMPFPEAIRQSHRHQPFSSFLQQTLLTDGPRKWLRLQLLTPLLHKVLFHPHESLVSSRTLCRLLKFSSIAPA